MKRPLIVGHRPSGSSEYHVRVYGKGETRFPPAELRTTLRGLAQWLSHGDAAPAEQDDSTPKLQVV
jgi:hypothetical protein